VVLVISDVGVPVGVRSAGVAGGFGDGQVRHEVVRGGAVPVLLAGWGPDDVAAADNDDSPTPGLHEPDAVGDVEGLAEGVGVPGAAGAGGEANLVRPGTGGLFADVDGSRLDNDLEGGSVGHGLVAVGDPVQFDGEVEHLSGFDRAVEDVGEQLGDIRRGPGRRRR
jgi:hypothetical protein